MKKLGLLGPFVSAIDENHSNMESVKHPHIHITWVGRLYDGGNHSQHGRKNKCRDNFKTAMKINENKRQSLCNIVGVWVKSTTVRTQPAVQQNDSLLHLQLLPIHLQVARSLARSIFLPCVFARAGKVHRSNGRCRQLNLLGGSYCLSVRLCMKNVAVWLWPRMWWCFARDCCNAMQRILSIDPQLRDSVSRFFWLPFHHCWVEFRPYSALFRPTKTLPFVLPFYMSWCWSMLSLLLLKAVTSFAPASFVLASAVRNGRENYWKHSFRTFPVSFLISFPSFLLWTIGGNGFDLQLLSFNFQIVDGFRLFFYCLSS